MSEHTPVPVKDNEAVYDEQISPLMRRVLAICKEHGIPMFASFVYAPGQFCTSSIPGPDDDEASVQLQKCCAYVRRGVPDFAAFTITMVTER